MRYFKVNYLASHVTSGSTVNGSCSMTSNGFLVQRLTVDEILRMNNHSFKDVVITNWIELSLEEFNCYYERNETNPTTTP